MIETTIDTLGEFAAGEFDPAEFESWLYADSALEREIGAKPYLELISLDYRRPESRMRGRALAAVVVEALAPAAWNRRLEELRERLERDIHLAFKDVSRGEGISLREAGVLDDRGSDADRLEERKRDVEQGWENVPSIDLERYPILFLDAQGLRYYIPAYMLWALNVCSDPLAGTLHSVVFCLVHCVDAAKFRAFSRDQKRVIVRFLWYISLRFTEFRDDVHEGLRDGWAECSEGG